MGDLRCWDAKISCLSFSYWKATRNRRSQLLSSGKLIPTLRGDFCIRFPRLLFHRQVIPDCSQLRARLEAARERTEDAMTPRLCPEERRPLLCILLKEEASQIF